MNQPSVAVVGAGAIGGITAAFIKQAGHNVTLVCKHQEIADLTSGPGLKISGVRGEHTVSLPAVATVAELPEPPDLVLLAVKATDMLNAATALLPLLADSSMVVSLQNGICEEALAQVLGKERVMGCVVGWGATLNGPGELEMTSIGDFVLGRLDGRSHPQLNPLQNILSSVVQVRLSTNIMGELYSKLIINSCITSLGAVCGLLLGQMLARMDARRLFLAVMREAMAVAEAMDLAVEPGGGGKLDYYRLLKGDAWLDDMRRHLMVRLVGLKYRRLKSSMLQSLQRGRPTEIDYLSGYIMQKGRQLHVPTPVNAATVGMVKAIENGQRGISADNLLELAKVI